MIATIAFNLLPIVFAGMAALYFSRGARRELKVLAWIPVAPLANWGFVFTRDEMRNPTSHNLWPFELGFWLLISAGLFGAWFVVKLLLSPRTEMPSQLQSGEVADNQPHLVPSDPTPRPRTRQQALFVIALFVTAVVWTWCPGA